MGFMDTLPVGHRQGFDSLMKHSDSVGRELDWG